MMDFSTDITKLFLSLEQTTEIFGINDIIITIALSFGLSMIIASTYKITYKGVTYTQSYVHTLIMMSVIVAIIMLIIGSSIARAFTLVGALSVIRFRNAIRDTRDVGYIFFAMAIGMACGMRLYPTAVVSTVMVCFISWVMFRMNLFASNAQILKLRLPIDMSYDNLFNETFSKYLDRFDMLKMEMAQAGTMTELVYGIQLKKQTNMQEFLNGLRQLNHDNKVVLITGYHDID